MDYRVLNELRIFNENSVKNHIKVVIERFNHTYNENIPNISMLNMTRKIAIGYILHCTNDFILKIT